MVIVEFVREKWKDKDELEEWRWMHQAMAQPKDSNKSSVHYCVARRIRKDGTVLLVASDAAGVAGSAALLDSCN